MKRHMEPSKILYNQMSGLYKWSTVWGKSDIEHEEPINVVFFRLQYAELRMLELY